MKTYEVTLFVLGVNAPALNEREYYEAESQEEAEQMAHDKWFPKGYGVLSSREYRENLSEYQEEMARSHMHDILEKVVPDACDREDIISAIEEDVYMDIEQCSDWLNMDEDEWCPGDVEIAVARILKERICG